MYKKKIKKIILEISPLVLIFIGSILLTLSLRLVNPAEGKGSIKIFGSPIIIPQQNDVLFIWGMIFFILGSLWEITKIIVRNFQTSANNE